MICMTYDLPQKLTEDLTSTTNTNIYYRVLSKGPIQRGVLLRRVKRSYFLIFKSQVLQNVLLLVVICRHYYWISCSDTQIVKTLGKFFIKLFIKNKFSSLNS